MPSTLLIRSTRTLIRRLRQERGQALAEFAVVVPVLMLIIVGIFTFGRYENYSSQETQLAAEAARWAAVNSNPAGTGSLQAYVQQQTTGGLQSVSSDVTSAAAVYLYYPTDATCSTAGAIGCEVRACVTATVALLPMLGSVTSATIAQTATMRIEQAASHWSPDSLTTVPSQCPTS